MQIRHLKTEKGGENGIKGTFGVEGLCLAVGRFLEMEGEKEEVEEEHDFY